MSKASRERERERTARKKRNGFATWEEFRNWQDEQRAIWLLKNADCSFSLDSKDTHEYIPYEDFPLKSSPSEWEEVTNLA